MPRKEKGKKVVREAGVKDGTSTNLPAKQRQHLDPMPYMDISSDGQMSKIEVTYLTTRLSVLSRRRTQNRLVLQDSGRRGARTELCLGGKKRRRLQASFRKRTFLPEEVVRGRGGCSEKRKLVEKAKLVEQKKLVEEVGRERRREAKMLRVLEA